MIFELADKKVLYDYYKKIKSDIPYWFDVDFKNWYKSMFEDTDCDGNSLFLELKTLISMENNAVNGFIQFGIPAFVHDNNGEKNTTIKAGIIRNIYFEKEDISMGEALIESALLYFQENQIQKQYSFYHYFGMTCNAGHGKLHCSHFYIEDLLLKYDFIKEHENVYYSRLISEKDIFESENITLQYSDTNEGVCEFSILFKDTISDKKIGEGCYVYLPQGKICYLKWIYVDDMYKSRGYASAALMQLFSDLRKQHIYRIDTDTADSNLAAQGLYIKTGFTDMGRTRSYLK